MDTPNIRIVPPTTTGLLKDLPYGTVVEWEGGPCLVVYGNETESCECQLVSLRDAMDTFDCSSDIRLRSAPLPILGRLEVTNGVPEVKATDDGIDWKARTEKFERWLRRMLESVNPHATRPYVESEMRKDGLL